LGLYEYVRTTRGPVSSSMTGRSPGDAQGGARLFHAEIAGEWRPFVQKAVKELLDAAEKKGRMDVMRDLATPLPVLVIAEMMGVRGSGPWLYPGTGRKASLYRSRRARPDEAVTEGMKGMIDYVSPLVDERLVNPGDDFISVLASGEKAGVFTRHQVLVNTSLLLLAGHETTINLLCNGTLAFINHPTNGPLLKQDPAGAAKLATEECLRYDSPVKSIQRIASEDVEMRGRC